jgi:hypothetical protein
MMLKFLGFWEPVEATVAGEALACLPSFYWLLPQQEPWQEEPSSCPSWIAMTWEAVFFLMGSSSVDLLVGFFSCKLLLLLPQALQASTSYTSLTSNYCESDVVVRLR